MRSFALAAAFSVCLSLIACSSEPYTLRGRVIEGDYSAITFVPADDPRLGVRGIASVKLVLHRDADKSWPTRFGQTISGPAGEIHFPVDTFGAGWMIEQWLIEAYKPGYETGQLITALPAKKADQRLLIMMAPGPSTPLRPENELWEQYEQFR